ncbi:MAG TPA: hypothetical protein VIU81_12080 [Gaiellaceae bacterium]
MSLLLIGLVLVVVLPVLVAGRRSASLGSVPATAADEAGQLVPLMDGTHRIVRTALPAPGATGGLVYTDGSTIRVIGRGQLRLH